LSIISQAGTLVSQVLILFILMGVGFACDKFGILTPRGVKQLSRVLLTIVTPCVLLSAFQTPFDSKKAIGLAIAFAAAFCCHLIPMGIGLLVYKNKERRRAVILKAAIIYSNCGFMGIPLLQAVLGNDGVFYGSAFIAVMNLLIWTHGVFLYTGKRNIHTVKKALLNPGVLGVAAGILLFVFSVKLPNVIATPIQYLANLNTPVAMLVIGTYMVRANLKTLFADRDVYLAAALRLIVTPLIAVAALKLLHIDPVVATAMVICSAAPTAANTAIFAGMYNADTELASKMVTATTVLSILTMPVMILLIQL
jgi:predicted permease